MPVLYDDGTGGQLYLLPGNTRWQSVKAYMACLLAQAEADALAIHAATGIPKPSSAVSEP